MNFGIPLTYLHQLRKETAFVLLCEIINVHAGAENCTAIHLHPFRALCQREFFGFHRFFPVFLGFVRIRALFFRKIAGKYKNLPPPMSSTTPCSSRRKHLAPLPERLHKTQISASNPVEKPGQQQKFTSVP
jgi:hypothetical protein